MLIAVFILGVPAQSQAPKIEYPDLDRMVLIQENSLMSNNCPSSPKTSVYGALGALESESMEELVKEKYPELATIITCESNWKNICNQEYGCYAGMGLAQFIPGTWDYVMEKIGETGDPFDEDLNLEAAIWLYTNEGCRHWEPSAHCHHCY